MKTNDYTALNYPLCYTTEKANVWQARESNIIWFYPIPN